MERTTCQSNTGCQHSEFDEALSRLYRNGQGREAQVAQIMRRITEQPMPRSQERRRGRWPVWLATTAAILLLVAGTLWLGRGLLTDSRDRESLARSASSPSDDIQPGDAPPAEDAAGDMPSLESVMARATVVVLGRMGRTTMVDGVPYVQIAVEKVLKGTLEKKQLQIEDRLTLYVDGSYGGDVKPGPAHEPLSGKFGEGTRVILYFGVTEQTGLRLKAAQEPTKCFLDIFEIAQGLQPVEKLPGILAPAVPYDPDVVVSLELFANERIAPVLMDVFEADIRSRREAIQAELTPQPNHCLTEQAMAKLLQGTLPAEEQPRLFDAILDRIELAIQEDANRKRLPPNRYRVSRLIEHMPRFYPELDAGRLARLRQVLMDLLRGCTAVDQPVGLDYAVPQMLGRVADRATIDLLLEEQARRPITRLHGYVPRGLAAALDVADEADRKRILDAWRKALAEIKPASDVRNPDHRESNFEREIIFALGWAADPGGIDLLLEEQAKRPITERHARVATALALSAERLGESYQQRIQQSWIEIVRALTPPLDHPQQEFVASVALYLTEEPFMFGPNEQETFQQILKSMPEKYYWSQVEEALRKASER
jgi:hypothetical protein